jgi:DNA-binding transcriptional MocR family regulator
VSDEAAAAAAAARGVEAYPLSRCRLAPVGAAARGALLLSCAAFDARAIRAGVRKLRPALESVMPG